MLHVDNYTNSATACYKHATWRTHTRHPVNTVAIVKLMPTGVKPTHAQITARKSRFIDSDDDDRITQNDSKLAGGIIKGNFIGLNCNPLSSKFTLTRR